MHDPMNDEPLQNELDGIELPEREYELTEESKAMIERIMNAQDDLERGQESVRN